MTEKIRTMSLAESWITHYHYELTFSGEYVSIDLTPPS